MLSNHLILCCPLLLLLPTSLSISPSIRVSSNKLVLHIRWKSIGASASASVLPMNIQSWFNLGLTGLISLLSKEIFSRESSPTPKFKSISSSVLQLYGSTLTSIHYYWKNHSFDCPLLMLHTVFVYLCYIWSLQPSKKTFQSKPFNYLPSLRKV